MYYKMKFHFLYMFFTSIVLCERHTIENGICYKIDDNNQRQIEDCFSSTVSTSTVSTSSVSTSSSASTSSTANSNSVNSATSNSANLLYLNLLFSILV